MSEWFAYDWEVRGLPARFRVDLQYAEQPDLRERFVTLLFVTAVPRREGAAAFSFMERGRLEPMLQHCRALLGEAGVHVGTVSLGAQVRHYFYTSDARLLVPLYAYCSRERGLRLSCSKAEEPGWETYRQYLCPDAGKRQSAANRAFIADRLARGDDVATPRRIDLTFRFATMQQRTRFGAEAATLGFVAGRAGFDEDLDAPYTLTLHASAPLVFETLTALTAEAIAAAAPLAGQLDHLDAVFLPKRRPR